MNLEAVRDAVEAATGTRPQGTPESIGGGCIHEAFRLDGYFVKSNSPDCDAMFEAERLGLAELEASHTVRVPRPLCTGANSELAFLVLEYLPLGHRSADSQEDLGRQLAALHRTSQDRFGWTKDNFIGATPQSNKRAASWIEFLRDRRLAHMLGRARSKGYAFNGVSALLDNLDWFFDEEPAPSLLHGDLWGGNASALKDGAPVIFDPAVYYGDREADLAMTRLFGGFTGAFYAAYEEAWPLPDGHERRRDLYNLYHILNHAVLFGGGYARQAQAMIDGLVRSR